MRQHKRRTLAVSPNMSCCETTAREGGRMLGGAIERGGRDEEKEAG